MCLSAANPEGDPPGHCQRKAQTIPSLAKEIPETIDDLRAMEKQPSKVPQAGDSQRRLHSDRGQLGQRRHRQRDWSGLTAGHVSGQPGTNAFVILQNGKQLRQEPGNERRHR